jgi:hypothetical protein
MRNASNDARRMAQDPPIYPAERKPGTPTGDFIHARIHGRLVQIELHAPKPTQYGIRPRNDQWCAVIDGEQWSPAAGLVLVLEELRKRVPRAMSRRAIATMER